MKAAFASSLLALVLRGSLALSAAPVPAPDALKSFELEPGLKVELVAAEPFVVAPCATVWDERGRLFVAENRGYPLGGPGGKAIGRVALLEDTDGDGIPDKRTEFAEGLSYPNGLLPWRGGLIVTCSPEVFYLKDTDGDGKADVKEVLLTGFATNQTTQLRVNKPMLAKDGWVYLASGLSSGRISSPKQPGMPPLDLKGDLRFKPDTGEYEGIDGKSQFGQDFDEAGRRFGVFNRVQVRHFVLPSPYVARNPHLASPGVMQDCPELVDNPLMRGGGGAPILHPISDNVTTADSHKGTFTAACAIHLWRGGNLPDRYMRRGVFSCDPTANLVHFDRLSPSGATFKAAPATDAGTEFLRTADGWFRPVYLATGPDGALYICDMYRKSIEHPEYLPPEVRKRFDFESGREMGRIWRVRSAASPSVRARKLNDATPAILLGALADRNSWVRDTAFRLLFEGLSGLNENLLEESWEDQMDNPAAAISLLSLLELRGKLDTELVLKGLEHADMDVRAWALKLAEPRINRSPGTLSLVLPRSHDASLVQFQAALCLGFATDPRALDGLADILAGASDKWTRAAVWSSAAGRELDVFRRIPDSRRSRLPLAVLADLGALAAASPSRDSWRELLEISKNLPAPSRAALLASFAERRGNLDESEGAVLELCREAGKKALSSSELLEARLECVRLLGFAGPGEAGPILLALCQPDKPRELQLGAVRALARRKDPAGQLLEKELWRRFSPAVREGILSSFFAQPHRLSDLLEALERRQIGASEITAPRRDLLLKNKDESVRNRARKLFEAIVPEDRMKAYEASREALALKPNSRHGKEIFGKACANCHRLDGEGYAVGPDLFDIRHQPKEAILLHIVVPEYEIAPNFANYVVETKDGRSLSGLLAGETPGSVTLRQALGVEETIQRSQIQSIAMAKLSLMPQELEKGLSRQDLADLLAYVKGE